MDPHIETIGFGFNLGEEQEKKIAILKQLFQFTDDDIDDIYDSKKF